VVVALLSRDFDVSLALVGATDTRTLNELRVSLGVLHATGGFEASSADRPYDKSLKQYALDQLGSDVVNARLQNIIQQRAGECDVVVIDGLLAWAYRPAGLSLPLVYLCQSVVADQFADLGVLARLPYRGIGAYERSVFDGVDLLFAEPDLAADLSERGVALKTLQCSFSRPGAARPSLFDVDRNLTAERIGYIGYLSDDKNLASLTWFLEEVWPILSASMPELNFHIVGQAPTRELRELIANTPRLHLHWSSDDQVLFDKRIRLMVDPLLYESHVDAKLLNAMARGIPLVTTRRGLERAHPSLRPGATSADSADAIKTLMADGKAWKSRSYNASGIGRAQLPAYELGHTMRREILRQLTTAGAD
jgi:glycosyltransferase involved in cell wall biosynthesis